jgi:hypothetical protein
MGKINYRASREARLPLTGFPLHAASDHIYDIVDRFPIIDKRKATRKYKEQQDV